MKKQNDNQKAPSTNINWFPGHMAKATHEIEDRVKLVDIVIELRDARAPLSSANPVIARIQKPHLIILTKKDLADDKKTDAWVKQLSTSQTKVMALDLTQFKNYQEIVRESKNLLADKMEKERAKGLKPRPIRAMVVGIPNVGKSTFINRLAKRNAAKTGNRPGVTVSQQIIKVDKDFELFDTPGILWPKFDDQQVAMHIALLGSIKSTILPHDDIYAYAMRFLAIEYPQYLQARYQLTIDLEDENWLIQTFEHIHQLRHLQLVRGEIDYDRIMDMIFNDIIKGTMGKITWEK